MSLTQKHCVPCEGGIKPFSPAQTKKYLGEVPKWEVVGNKKIKRELKFKNFARTMKFVNKVAGLAEEEGHHPDFKINYSKVSLELSTHAIGGLSENDFILAAKIDQMQP